MNRPSHTFQGQAARQGNIPQAMLTPSIGIDGRIHTPGFPAGLNLAAYRQLVALYRRIAEAHRVVETYAPFLRFSLKNAPHNALTPLDPSSAFSTLYYKREDLTATRAYKLRGALVGISKVMEYRGCHRFLAVSTGNHALGVLKAAELLRPQSVRIVVPTSTAPCKLEKIDRQVSRLRGKGLAASVVLAGETFDEARNWAMRRNAGEYYLDPYSDPWVVAGQGTIGLELHRQLAVLLEQHPACKELALVAPVGGGGLLAGTATALRMATAWDSRFRNLSLKLVGVKLDSLDSLYGDAIKVQQIAPANRVLFDFLGVTQVTVDDPAMKRGMAFIADDLGAAVEGASAGTLHPVFCEPGCRPTEQRLVVSLVSGGNVDQGR